MTHIHNPLHDRLFQPNAAREGAFLALPEGPDLSFQQFDALCRRMASALLALGVLPGDRVAAQIEKSPAGLALYAGCVRIGAVYLPLNTAYTNDELSFFISDCGASVLFCDPSRAASLSPMVAGLDVRLVSLDSDGGGDWMTHTGPTTPPPAPRAADDLAAILYTSGTTGRPKGAMLSQSNLLSNAEVLADLWRISADDVLLHALPVYHSHGLFVATNTVFLRGARMIYLPRFDPDAVIAALPGASMMMGVPTFYSRLLESAAFDRAACAGMRVFISGSAPLLPQTHAAFAARTGHRILERYGLTETSMNSSNPLDGERKPGTVGPALPGVEIRIAAPDDGAAVGEIEVRGPNVFRGYWGLPAQTADAFTPDGFFRTGDLGTFDAQGYLSIVGRSKDLIISGGLNIYPREVEAEIDTLDGVAESAVIGLPDHDFGERVVAVIVPCDTGRPDPEALSRALRSRIAGFKIPKEWVMADALPRNAMGKVQKNLLRERLTAR